ncbi:MAG: hypothetical protein KC553_08625 [Nitrospina sp.]|nr:hypothetical protein [Nitrospina sp.]
MSLMDALHTHNIGGIFPKLKGFRPFFAVLPQGIDLRSLEKRPWVVGRPLGLSGLRIAGTKIPVY